MEEHLVPAVLPAQHHGHDVVKHRPGAARILCQELVPRQAWAVLSLEFRFFFFLSTFFRLTNPSSAESTLWKVTGHADPLTLIQPCLLSPLSDTLFTCWSLPIGLHMHGGQCPGFLNGC